MNWGHKITITFVLFAAIIISMVVISMNQNIDLVATNYYEEEIAYQDQIERIENYRHLDSKPLVTRVGNQLILTFEAAEATQLERGVLHFYRPSEAGLDVKLPISLNDQYEQNFSVQNLKSGLWKMKLTWHTAEKEYFIEQSIVI